MPVVQMREAARRLIGNVDDDSNFAEINERKSTATQEELEPIRRNFDCVFANPAWVANVPYHWVHDNEIELSESVDLVASG